jgi:hypothetical protein
MAIAAVLSMASGAPAFSQEVRGVVTGIVKDPTGSVLPDVEITVLATESGVQQSTKTNHDGIYEVPFLLPGIYKVSAQMHGFDRMEQRDFRVDAGARITVDFAMHMGSETVSVNVSADTPLVETTNSDLSQLVPQAVVADVASSIYRNAANFVRLAPGVTGQSQGTYTSDNQTAISINGGGGVQGGNEWVLDGMPDTVPLSTGSIVVVPSVDSVDQMKVNATMLDASLGRTTGGAVVTATKAGTNTWHGTLYGFGRWKGLNANSWSNDRNHVARPDVNYYQTGYYLGGPITIPHLFSGKNRLFFASSYERDNDVRDLSETTRVPSAAEAHGDFSATLSQAGTPLVLYNPYSTTLSSTGTFSSRTQFQCVGGAPVAPVLSPGPTYGTQATGTNCAIMPQALINPIGHAILQTLLTESGGPNMAGVNNQLGVNNWYADATYTVGQTNLSERVDYVISDKQRLFARYSYLTRDQRPTTLIYGAQQYNGSGANIDTYLQSRYSATLNDTYILSPSLVASVGVGFVRRVNNDSYGSFGQSVPSEWNLPASLTSNQAITGWPNFAIDSADTGVSIGARANLIANNGFTTIATLTQVRGKHSFKYGVDWRTYQFNTASQGVSAAGTFTVTQKFTASNPTSTSALQSSGSGVASLLLGMADSGSLAATAPLTLQNRYIAGYVQDNWRLLPKLTLTLGLRYDFETPYTERHNQISFGFDPNAPVNLNFPGRTLTGGIMFAGVNGNSRQGGKLDTNNFGPRVGFAFAPNPGSVFRGGYALFYSPFNELISNQGSVPSFSSSTTYVGTTNSSATATTTISNPFPNGITQPAGTSKSVLTQAGSSISFVNQNRVVPYSQQWQFSIQQQLRKGADLQVAYVGMLSLKEFESFDLDELPLALNVSTQNNQVTNPFFGQLPTNTTLGASASIAQHFLQTAFPQFTSVTEDGVNSGTSTYQALQARIQQRIGNSLYVLGTYTWSKLERNNITSLVNKSYYHNSLVNYHSISSLDQPHLLRLTMIYTVPRLFGGDGFGRGVLRNALSGWEISNYFDLESGLPLAITGSNGRPIIQGNPATSGPIRNRLGNIKGSNGLPVNPYFNPAAFIQLSSQFYNISAATPGGVSPTPPYRGDIRAPYTDSLNTALMKNFAIHERLNLQLRGEAFNVTNHPTYGTPSLNSSVLSSFGVITGASNNRQMQVGVKAIF